MLAQPARLAAFLPALLALVSLLAQARCTPESGMVQGASTGVDGAPAVDPGSPGAGNGSGVVTVPIPAGSPFEPVSAPVSARRIKNLLTGEVPSQAEVDAVAQDGSKLGDLVTQWMATPAYRSKMEQFFGDAFQQSQAQAVDFNLSLDNTWFAPNDALLLNFRQSFGKTVMALIAENAPFTQVATTQRYMMTTAMMAHLAYTDIVIQGDAPAPGRGGPTSDRIIADNPGFSYQLVRRSGAIDIADSANPKSPNYMKFYIPTLGDAYRAPGSPNQGDTAYCRQFDPIVENKNSSFEYEGGLTKWLYAALNGTEYRFFQPPQDQPNPMFCSSEPTQRPIIAGTDHTDWRMVTVRRPSSMAEQSRFWDLASLRSARTLSIYSPRLGYFTTPAFLSQWNTNISNQARVTANQTLIVGLGRAVDGTLAVALDRNTPGLNAQHAADPVCMGCHITLDPLRQFFRQSYSLTFSAQNDPAQQAMQGTFGYDGVTGAGDIYELGRLIGSHPRFRLAWAQKLCNWANSTVCDPTDPELIRIADVFASSNYNWNTLVHEMFTSPITTYSAATKTTTTQGVTTPIARRAHLCAALDARLNLSDSCGLGTLQDGSRGSSLQNLAYTLPHDQYSRGSVDPIYVTQPDLFFRNIVENICAQVAGQVVDAGPNMFKSSAPQEAAAALAHNLLGLDASQDAPVIDALMAHFNHATQMNVERGAALRSMFVLACISPYMTSIGQ